MTEFAALIGLTLAAVKGVVGEDEMIFTAENGDRYILYHSQDCCESVDINDIVGDIADLVGSPILVAEEREGESAGGGEYESSTWTFYALRTIRGSVDVRWLGTSNGYYSESVSFRREAA